MLIDSPNPCLECGKTFKAPRKRFNEGPKKQRFCSLKCSQRYNGRKRITNMVNCLCCGKQFRGRTRDQETSKGNKYCSPECRQKYCGITKTCVECGKSFNTYDKRKYCSRECYRNAHQTKVTKLSCHTCGKEFERPTAFANRSDRDPKHRYYCSGECQRLGLTGEKNPGFLGVRKAYRGDSWNEQRKMMKLKYQHCRFCGDAVLGRTSHVDHIVPFKESRFGRNDPNGEDNLWVLCRSCHRKKTTIEMVLYREGRELYIEKLVELSGDLFVRKELEKAFEYCQLPS